MSNFSFFDGSIVAAYLVACMTAGVIVYRYVGKVEDFLVAGREMNLYLGIASLAATEFGIVTCMNNAQLGYTKGFAGITPGIILALAMPKFLSTFVPVGIMGILIAAMLAADMSTDAAYMLSWSSVIYNDILAPVHKNQWSRKKGLLCNRIIVGCIGVFLLFYGLWYELKGDLWSYLMVTGTIYLSSMSVLLIACCYWKRANNWGAAGAIIVGAVMPISFLVLEQIDATEKIVTQQIGSNVLGISTFICTAAAMIIGSLLKPKTEVK